LLGGNLSVLTRLLGTPFLPDLAGAVLVLEDVAEAPYRIDRMLAHLALAGVLDRLGGVVLGRFTHATADGPSLSVDEVLADYFAARPYPVAAGLAYGHVLPRLTLPWGVRARLAVTPRAASLTLLEPVVATADDPAPGEAA
jgi:muramoyltetrapeptide carboxypeptidase